MDVRPGSATTLVMRALIHAERRGYLVGLVMGRGCRGLLPRRSDLLDTFRMLPYYLGIPFVKLTRRQMAASPFQHQVQRTAARGIFLCSDGRAPFGSYALGDSQTDAAPLAGCPFGGYHAARVWHFWLMWLFILFVVPHVILVFADGWDTLRSMIAGWSTRVTRPEVMANEQKGKESARLLRRATSPCN